MTPIVLFIVGAPGVGKTAIARHMMPDPDSLADPRLLQPRPKATIHNHVVAAGHYEGKDFDGADTVSYSGAAAWLDWWVLRGNEFELTLLDGDRFSNGKVLAALKERTPRHRLACVHAVADDRTLEHRRQLRGSNQNPSWIKGRATKSERFAALFDGKDSYRLDTAERTPEELAGAIRIWLDLTN